LPSSTSTSAATCAFNRSKDGGYNKKIEQMLREIRFRPAVRPDGTPVAAKVSLNWTVY
jgi:hypothetical protein